MDTGLRRGNADRTISSAAEADLTLLDGLNDRLNVGAAGADRGGSGCGLGGSGLLTFTASGRVTSTGFGEDVRARPESRFLLLSGMGMCRSSIDVAELRLL